MSVSTYANLQTAVATTLHRSDLTNQIPDFISLCEAKLNRKLRLRGMEVRVQASVNTEYMTLPSRFLAIKNLQVNSSPRTPLKFATPDYLDIKYPDPTATNTPQFYSLAGGEIQLAPVPDTTYTIEMDYYQSLALATDSTNWVLTNAPGVYYYGTLVEAALYLKDQKMIDRWEPLFDRAIEDLDLSDSYDQIPDESLSIRSEMVVR